MIPNIDEVHLWTQTSFLWKVPQILSRSIIIRFWGNAVADCVYHKFFGSRYIFLVLYVDDILLTRSDMSLLSDTRRFLSMNFEMKDFGDAFFTLGIQIHRDHSWGILGLSQKTYIEKVLQRFGMQIVSHMTSPWIRVINSVLANALKIKFRQNSCKNSLMLWQ